MSSSTVRQLVETLLHGLTDYTMDERGDVGSWIRITCIKGLASFAETLFSCSQALPELDAIFPPSKYHDAIAGILKQGVERLDNVRLQAGQQFRKLLLLSLPVTENSELWRIRDEDLMRRLFVR